VLRAPQAARVLGASLIGRVPLGAAPLALLIFARDRVSLAVAALFVAAYTGGVALGGPALARLADRWRQPPVLWLAVAGSTVGFAMVVVGPTWVQVVGAALAGLGAPPFEACLRVLWRDLLPPAAVPSAYTVDIAAQELIFVLGPLATAGSVGTIWFATAPVVRHWRGEAAHRHWLGALRSVALRIILFAILLIGSAVGSVIVAATGYAEARGSTASAGLLIAAQAAGALIGGLAYTRLGPRARGWRLPWIAGAMALTYVPLVLTPVPGAMLALLLLSGLGLPVLLTVGFLTVDEVAPPGTAAEAFAWVGTAFAVGSALGSALTGWILDASGTVRVGFVVGPVALALAALTLTALPRRVATKPA
jgi:predicted MFS family arabinose efflux permease